MSTRKLSEHGALLESVDGKGKFRVRIITEGRGSSGTYSRELLEEYKDVFAGRPMFMNHPKDPSRPEMRDVRDIAGRVAPMVEFMVDDDGVAGLYAEVSVDKRYADFVAEYQDIIGVSIFASGEGRQENGEYIVESFDMSDSYTSVDYVVAAGRGGRVERMLESYRQIENSVGQLTVDDVVTAIVEDEKMENQMDEQKIVALFEALTAKVDALDVKVSGIVTLSEQAAADVAANVDAFDVAEELTTAVAEAKLPESGRKRVIESVKAGVAVADAVAAEKAYVAEIVKQVSEAVKVDVVAAGQGRIVESTSGAYSFNDFVKVGA
jgi:hypothetical protein